MNRGFEYRTQVETDGAGASIGDYLARRFGASSREEWLNRIRDGRVLVNGLPVDESAVLQPGQLVTWVRPPWEEPPAPVSFAVLYHQAGVLAAAKPSGLPTLPGGGEFMDKTLLALVCRRFPDARPLHRLGRATSGIVLFATTGDARRELARAWRDREVVKVYRALVAGSPNCDAWAIDTPIGPVPHPVLGTVQAASTSGRPAHSDVEVVERRDGCTLVDVRIATGRPHQIRVHLASAGHPLVGDPLYVAGGVPATDSRAVPGDPGYLLHAGWLSFAHPVTGEWTEIFCLPPPALRRAHSSPDGTRGA